MLCNLLQMNILFTVLSTFQVQVATTLCYFATLLLLFWHSRQDQCLEACYFARKQLFCFSVINASILDAAAARLVLDTIPFMLPVK